MPALRGAVTLRHFWYRYPQVPSQRFDQKDYCTCSMFRSAMQALQEFVPFILAVLAPSRLLLFLSLLRPASDPRATWEQLNVSFARHGRYDSVLAFQNELRVVAALTANEVIDGHSRGASGHVSFEECEIHQGRGGAKLLRADHSVNFPLRGHQLDAEVGVF